MLKHLNSPPWNKIYYGFTSHFHLKAEKAKQYVPRAISWSSEHTDDEQITDIIK